MLNIFYSILVEHASAEQTAETNATLDAPTEAADSRLPERERRLLAAINSTFASTLDG